MTAATKPTPKKIKLFLAHLAETGNVTESSMVAGSNKTCWYDLRKRDPDFAKAWDEALMHATDALIEEGRRRALKGIEEPVFYQGNVCGHIQRYSDVLLMFLVKAHRPEYATERRKVDMNTDGLKELADVLKAGPVPRTKGAEE